MNLFASLLHKIFDLESSGQPSVHISGLNFDQLLFALSCFKKESANFFSKKSNLFILSTNDEAEEFYEKLKSYIKDIEILFFPGIDASPYSGVFAFEKNLYDRFGTLNRIILLKKIERPFILITSIEGASFKNPPKKFFLENQLELRPDDIISFEMLQKKLVALGYSRSSSTEEPGTFAIKGHIFDIYPVGQDPVRLSFFDDLIEKIHRIDPNNQRTINDEEVHLVTIIPNPGILTDSSYSLNLRENIPQFGPSAKNKFENRKAIFQKLTDGMLFENYTAFLPLFFKDPINLFDYLNEFNFRTTLVNAESLKRDFLDFRELLRFEFDQSEQDANSDCILPGPDRLYDFNFFLNLDSFNTIQVDQLNLIGAEKNLISSIDLKLIPTKMYFNQFLNPGLLKHEYIEGVLKLIGKQFLYDGKILISSNNAVSHDEIKHLISLQDYGPDLLGRIHYIEEQIEEGFFYAAEKTLVLATADLFANKQKKIEQHKKVDLDLFAEQLATLKIGDYVIHSDFGVGEYLGLESLEIGGDKSDFLILKYAEDDKVYVPVYKLNLIQKHADAAAKLKADSLRTNKFVALKTKARASAKELAFDLIKLQAERQISKAYAFSPPDHLYREFELLFPFEETPDQKRAIDDVLSSMQKALPMDHLVCGDVGFGKTEVAMRAAFKAVEDQKQVAVLVPTTILALQHYNTFSKRFKDFPIKIEFISRFKSAKESKEILERAERGDIDILIGTHKILTDKLKFKDLGLVIVDEEQRFGVQHKEKLKLMKSSVDFLTLTATPIPRTLQFAFLGLRDLSLIKTAPPKRQSIKTYVIKEDELTIQTAILKELKRGGQVFIVHNKVQDIEEYTARIRELAPDAKISFAHGQMTEKELEDKINDFYRGNFQILVSTTIIESGIDIPNANTMIIDRADTFGLSQLHQLRGRIGRSDKKAYAYFVIPATREISTIATKRLHALQTYAEMGSGFNIASVDLEIRGAGDILGASQSGHIEAVGLELYMELLKDAINEIKGERRLVKKDIEILTPFPAFIPNNYISNPSERLKQYKRLSNCDGLDGLMIIQSELEDIYGPFSIELSNLFIVLQTRITLQSLGLKSLHLSNQTLTLKFDQSLLNENIILRDKIVSFFLSHPKVYKFTPDYRVIYTHKVTINQSELLKIASDLAQKF